MTEPSASHIASVHTFTVRRALALRRKILEGRKGRIATKKEIAAEIAKEMRVTPDLFAALARRGCNAALPKRPKDQSVEKPILPAIFDAYADERRRAD